jgi:AcrR family transcriptional regulator
MGIPERKEREKARRKQQIIVAAKRVFTHKGFDKATMEDIANEAELSSGTIYIYFKNKNELYANMTLRVLQFLFIRLEHLHNDQKKKPEEKIAHLKKAFLDVYEFDPLVLKTLFNLQSSEAIQHLSPGLVDEIRALGRKALNKIAAIFKQGIRKGVCIDHPPQAIAAIVWSLFSGIVLWETEGHLNNRKRSYFKLQLEMAFEIFERGLLVTKSDPAEVALT